MTNKRFALMLSAALALAAFASMPARAGDGAQADIFTSALLHGNGVTVTFGTRYGAVATWCLRPSGTEHRTFTDLPPTGQPYRVLFQVHSERTCSGSIIYDEFVPFSISRSTLKGKHAYSVRIRNGKIVVLVME